MIQILIVVMLFLGLSTVTFADVPIRLATVPAPRKAANSNAIAMNYTAILREMIPLAERGNPEAQYKLGLMYYRGQGVAQNYVLACMWLYLANAGATGDFSANTVRTRFAIESSMLPSQVAYAQRLAIVWQKKRSPGMPTPSKEKLIDTFAKVEACRDAGHIEGASIDKEIVPRVQYYARLFFTERDIDEMGAKIPYRKESAVTWLGLGCKSAFETLYALPLPTGPSN
ncbi:MAG: hypothetical protein ACYDBA_11585 [Sulfuricaulis sp.]